MTVSSGKSVDYAESVIYVRLNSLTVLELRLFYFGYCLIRILFTWQQSISSDYTNFLV